MKMKNDEQLNVIVRIKQWKNNKFFVNIDLSAGVHHLSYLCNVLRCTQNENGWQR